MLENSNLLFRPWASNSSIELDDAYHNVKKLNQDYISKCADNSTTFNFSSVKSKTITDADRLKLLLNSSHKNLRETKVKNVKENSSTPASSSAETRLINSKIAALSSASQLFSLDTYNNFNPNVNTQIAAAVAATQNNSSSHSNCGAIPVNFVFSSLPSKINETSIVDTCFTNIDSDKNCLYTNLNSISNPNQILPIISPNLKSTQCISNTQILNQSIIPHNLPQIMPQPIMQQSILPAITTPENITQKIYTQPSSIINLQDTHSTSQLPILPAIQSNLTQIVQSRIESPNRETIFDKNWNEILSSQTSNQQIVLDNTTENSCFNTQLLSDNSHFSNNLLTHESYIKNLDKQNQPVKKVRPKKFQCEYCNVSFSNNGQLKGHIRIHTGERPFVCDQPNCGKRFTRNEELTRHKKIHTGLKPFSCDICGKKFGRKDHLKKHIRTHQRAATQQQFAFPLMSALNQYWYLKI